MRRAVKKKVKTHYLGNYHDFFLQIIIIIIITIIDIIITIANLKVERYVVVPSFLAWKSFSRSLPSLIWASLLLVGHQDDFFCSLIAITVIAIYIMLSFVFENWNSWSFLRWSWLHAWPRQLLGGGRSLYLHNGEAAILFPVSGLWDTLATTTTTITSKFQQQPDWVQLPGLLGHPSNNNGHPGSLGNPTREEESRHALATLVSFLLVQFLKYWNLSFQRYLLEVVTFVAVIVVSMVSWNNN